MPVRCYRLRRFWAILPTQHAITGTSRVNVWAARLIPSLTLGNTSYPDSQTLLQGLSQTSSASLKASSTLRAVSPARSPIQVNAASREAKKCMLFQTDPAGPTASQPDIPPGITIESAVSKGFTSEGPSGDTVSRMFAPVTGQVDSISAV